MSNIPPPSTHHASLSPSASVSSKLNFVRTTKRIGGALRMLTHKVICGAFLCCAKIGFAKLVKKLYDTYIAYHTHKIIDWELAYKPYYKDKGNKCEVGSRKVVIYKVDGIAFSPGLADKLKGIFSVYHLCRSYGLEFKICWTYPFNLTDYLLPNKYDWYIESDILEFSCNSAPILIDRTGRLYREDLVDWYAFKHRVVKTNLSQYHVYTNAIIKPGNFKKYFDELFKLSPPLKREIAQMKEKLGNNYISVSLRFVELLGDFKDNEGFSTPLPQEQQKELMERCYGKILEIISRYDENTKIFVASDSGTFLSYVSQNPRVVTSPGVPAHIQYVSTSESYMKTFVDMMLIRDAKTQYLLQTGKMWSSGFPKTASLLGNGKFKKVVF